MTVVEDTLRQARQLCDLARSLRSQAQDIRAHTRLLVAATAAAEDLFAAAIDRLAAQQPHRAEHVLGISKSARIRRRLVHPGGGSCDCGRGDPPAASQLARGSDGTPEAAASATMPDHAGDLSVIGERDRIAAQLQDTIIRRVFAAGLRLESAAGLTGDPEVRRRIEAAVGELDQVIREIRNVVFQDVQDRHLAPVVGVIPLQPRVARIGRVGLGQPERAARSNRLGVADRAQEPVPGLAAADRTAHCITQGLDRDGILAPRAQPRHAGPSAPGIAADSNGDSNDSSRQLPAATGDSAQRSHDPRQLGICPA